MGRKRKSALQPFLRGVADTEAGAELRRTTLEQAAKKALGRPRRLDLLRDAMALADLIPPTPRDKWRRFRAKTPRNATPTPRREARAATTLVQIFEARGENLTMPNATRAMEDGRKAVDATRNISPKDRDIIEEAKVILTTMRPTRQGTILITRREHSIVTQAVRVIQNAPTASKWDLEFLGGLRKIMPFVKVH